MKTIKIIPGMLLIADEIHLTVSINTEQVITIMPSNDQYGSFRYHLFNRSYFQWMANYYRSQ